MGGMYAKTPTVYQLEATECGAASLSMILAYYGKHLPLEQLRIETGVSRDGCSAGNIMRAAKKYGMECHGYRKEPDALRTQKMPCIIHWNFNHFVVLEGFKGRHAYINDPAVGRRKLTPEELDESFTGIVLTFQPGERFEKQKKADTWKSFIGQRLEGQYGVLGKLLAVGLLLSFPGILIPVLSQVFLDEILIAGNQSWFTKLLLFMAAAVLMQICLSLYRDRLLARLQKKMVLLSANSFLGRMFRLPISFFDQRYVGDLSGRAANNASVSDFLAGDLAETILNLLIAMFYLILLLLYSPILTLIAVLSVGLDLAVVKMTSGMIADSGMKLSQDAGKLSGAVCAGLSITSTLKASGAENEYVGRILGYHAKVEQMNQKLGRNQQILDAVPDTVKMCTEVLLLLTGGSLVIDGKMTIGMLAAFLSLFGSFHEPVEKLAGFMKKIQTAKADISRVEDIMNYPEDERFSGETEKKTLKTKLEGQVELRDISFGYSALKPPIVSGFDCRISCGSSIAFVGSSGCGKSTVSKVISGLYKPWTGQVLFDGIPMEQIPAEVLNASVSTVSQSITLFSDSIRNNLTMWNDSISESDMIAAAKDACIHDVISQKPGAYDFRLAEGASNLSGGQRQRLEIARALVTNPTVLIMDEATSALDPIVEKQIIDNIKRRGCTCIIIAHRLSAIRDCDQIIVMEEGQIVQRGTHRELAAAEGHYQTFIQNL